jgi:hypothetical protein
MGFFPLYLAIRLRQVRPSFLSLIKAKFGELTRKMRGRANKKEG